jgi:hypothetical protein
MAAMAAIMSAKTKTASVTVSTSRRSKASKNQRFHWLSATVAAVESRRAKARPSVRVQAEIAFLSRQ